MRHLRLPALAALLMLQCLLHAPAARAAEDEALLDEYAPPGWGFSLGLASYGEVYEPGDPEWAAPDLDWSWISGVDDRSVAPIYRIDGQTIPLTDEAGQPVTMSAEDFSGAYYDSMVEQWSNSANFSLLDSVQNYEGADGRLWQVFDLEEGTGENAQYYYALIGQDDDGTLRMISFFYEPTDDEEMQEAIAGMVMLHLDPSLADEAGEAEDA